MTHLHSHRQRFQGGGQLGKRVRIPLLSGHLLAPFEHAFRIGEAIFALQQHAELEVGGEVVRRAAQQFLQLGDGGFGVAAGLQLQGQRVARKRLVWILLEKSPELIDAIHFFSGPRA